jgi:hypothetical protein
LAIHTALMTQTPPKTKNMPPGYLTAKTKGECHSIRAEPWRMR